MPTASAVVGDVINVAGAISVPDFSPYFQPAIVAAQLSVRPIEEAESAFYIRLQTADTPGVMGNVGRAFGAHGVSMHSIIQRGMPGTDGATVTLLTYRTPEGRVARALEDIRTQTTTRAIAVALRVFEGE
jgi:homoserine dehydrogenase